MVAITRMFTITSRKMRFATCAMFMTLATPGRLSLGKTHKAIATCQ